MIEPTWVFLERYWLWLLTVGLGLFASRLVFRLDGLCAMALRGRTKEHGVMGKVTAGTVQGGRVAGYLLAILLELPCSAGFVSGVHLMPVDQIYDCNMLL